MEGYDYFGISDIYLKQEEIEKYNKVLNKIKDRDSSGIQSLFDINDNDLIKILNKILLDDNKWNDMNYYELLNLKTNLDIIISDTDIDIRTNIHNFIVKYQIFQNTNDLDILIKKYENDKYVKYVMEQLLDSVDKHFKKYF